MEGQRTSSDDEDRASEAVGHARAGRDRQGLTHCQRLASRICCRENVRVECVGSKEIPLYAIQAHRNDIA
jgi:hypothetical protein